jgi:hypothetical protein
LFVSFFSRGGKSDYNFSINEKYVQWLLTIFLLQNMDRNSRNLLAQLAARAMGLVDPQVLVLIDGVIDERVVVATTLVRFKAAVAKSHGLHDEDTSD